MSGRDTAESGLSIEQLLTVVFVFLGGPGGAYMSARALCRSQLPLHNRTIVDEQKTITEDIAKPHRVD
jgi:multisubunit Na+/H+ antiporter MnhG subunit